MCTTLAKVNIKDKCIECLLLGCPYRAQDYKMWIPRLKRVDVRSVLEQPPKHYESTCICKRCVAWRDKIATITNCIESCGCDLIVTRECYYEPDCKCSICFIEEEKVRAVKLLERRRVAKIRDEERLAQEKIEAEKRLAEEKAEDERIKREVAEKEEKRLKAVEDLKRRAKIYSKECSVNEADERAQFNLKHSTFISRVKDHHEVKQEKEYVLEVVYYKDSNFIFRCKTKCSVREKSGSRAIGAASRRFPNIEKVTIKKVLN